MKKPKAAEVEQTLSYPLPPAQEKKFVKATMVSSSQSALPKYAAVPRVPGRAVSVKCEKGRGFLCRRVLFQRLFLFGR